MVTFFQLSVNGLAMGMIYAMISIGLVLLIRAVGVLNFAQGDLVVLGAYATYWLGVQLQLPLIAVVVAAIILFSIFALLFMMGVYYPVRNSSWAFAVIICTIGASSIINESVTAIWGSRIIPIEPLVRGAVNIFGVPIEKQLLLTIGVAICIMVLVWLLFEKTFCGKIMLAAAQNRFAATLIGIPVMLTIAITYILDMNIVGFAGYLVSPILLLNTSLSSLQLKAFAGVVIGGYGSLKGSIIGSILIAMVEAYSSYVTTTYKDVFVFGVLILVLLFRPQGLFQGTKVGEKA